MNFRDQAAIAALQALIIAETWRPARAGDTPPVRPDARVLATRAWNHAQALVDTQPYMGESAAQPEPPIEMMTRLDDPLAEVRDHIQRNPDANDPA